MDGNAYQSGAEARWHSLEQVGNSCAKKDKSNGTRYFIMKSLNHENIQLSIAKGIWATQHMNEPILEEAFHVRCLSYSYLVCTTFSIAMVHREACVCFAEL